MRDRASQRLRGDYFATGAVLLCIAGGVVPQIRSPYALLHVKDHDQNDTCYARVCYPFTPPAVKPLTRYRWKIM